MLMDLLKIKKEEFGQVPQTVGLATPMSMSLKGIAYKMNIHDKGVAGSLEGLTTDTNGEVWGSYIKRTGKNKFGQSLIVDL